jgi:four helix bundle protein
MKSSVTRDKSYAFALKIIRLYKQLVSEHKEYVMSKQLLKAGTAPGALTREAQFAQSTPDFISKMSIALKEANEAEYWLCLLEDSGFISKDAAKEIKRDALEIVFLLASSVKTAKSNFEKQKDEKNNTDLKE